MKVELFYSRKDKPENYIIEELKTKIWRYVDGVILHSFFRIPFGLDNILKTLTDEEFMKFKSGKSENPKEKKEIQLVMSGDFFQLPPVLLKEDKVSLCKLTKIMRQNDTDFYKALDDCKESRTKCIVI